MNELYSVPLEWNNQKITKEYNKRKKRLTGYRVSSVLIILCALLGYLFQDPVLIGVSGIMFLFAFMLERHTYFIVNALSKAFR